MPRIIISNPENGKAYQIEADESQFRELIGLEISDQFDGNKIGLPGYKLKITGGSDEEGFPMRKDIKGEGRTQALFSGGTGYNPPQKGSRRRKTVRGGKISKNIAQLNTIIEESGKKTIEEALGIEKEEEIEKGTTEEKEKTGEEKEETKEEKKTKETGAKKSEEKEAEETKKENEKPGKE